jgi:predicted anti-sigma-YlaC factor YlaD
MSSDKYKDLLMGYLDDEISDQERVELEKHLTECDECTKELADFENLKSITDDITLYKPEDEVFDEYWSSIYNRIERSAGWIVLSVSGMLLLFYIGYMVIEDIIADPNLSCVFKGALLAFIAALSVLLVSVLRERLNTRKKDRYKDVRR